VPNYGIGRACAEALAAEGVNVIVGGPESELVRLAAAEIAAAHGVEARPVIADPCTQPGRDQLLAALPDPDILVTSNAWLEAGELPGAADGDLGLALRMHDMEQRYWAPAALAQTVVAGMRSRRFGRIVNITSDRGTARRPTLAPSAAGRGGMGAVMKGLAAQVAGDNITINQLVAEDSLLGPVPVGRRNRQAEELGAACALLCSAQAAHISGIDLHLSGSPRTLALVV
jgi:3-oxoacyl-[acyl-carrier protein] reductase